MSIGFPQQTSSASSENYNGRNTQSWKPLTVTTLGRAMSVFPNSTAQ